MITEIFSIYDMKVQAYSPPFNFRSKGEALRTFADMANDPASKIAKHPEDYVLYLVGSFDDQRGIVTPKLPHETLGKAVEFIQPSNQVVDLFTPEEQEHVS